VWLHYAKLALRDLEAGARAIHDVGELSRSNLRIASTPTFTAYLIGPLADRFHLMYPGITLAIHEMRQAQLEQDIADGELDLGIAFDPPRSAELESLPLFAEQLSLVVGHGHRLAARRKPLLHAVPLVPPIASRTATLL
jgi:LysR family transcriptional regulator, cyn operon transcriptional activator